MQHIWRLDMSCQFRFIINLINEEVLAIRKSALATMIPIADELLALSAEKREASIAAALKEARS